MNINNNIYLYNIIIKNYFSHILNVIYILLFLHCSILLFKFNYTFLLFVFQQILLDTIIFIIYFILHKIFLLDMPFIYFI